MRKLTAKKRKKLWVVQHIPVSIVALKQHRRIR